MTTTRARKTNWIDNPIVLTKRPRPGQRPIRNLSIRVRLKAAPPLPQPFTIDDQGNLSRSIRSN